MVAAIMQADIPSGQLQESVQQERGEGRLLSSYNNYDSTYEIHFYCCSKEFCLASFFF